MDRRQFVKAAVGVGAAAGLGAVGLGVASSLAKPRAPDAGPTRYFGAHLVGGPGPRGVPYIPVTVRDGVFVGKPTFPHGRHEWDALAWLRYCGHGVAPGLQHDFSGDDVIRYHVDPEKLKVITPWYADLLGEPIRPEDFPDAYFGASFVWRSPDPDDLHAIKGVLVKLPPDVIRFPDEPKEPALPITQPDDRRVLQEEVFHKDFVAASAWCTHFCCTAGWKEAENLAKPRDAWDKLFCTCHSLICDLREPAWYSFEPEP